MLVIENIHRYLCTDTYQTDDLRRFTKYMSRKLFRKRLRLEEELVNKISLLSNIDDVVNNLSAIILLTKISFEKLIELFMERKLVSFFLKFLP